jgi:predicted RNA-binding Zn-ribbon protein involved in translation (DUF1610 family)
MPNLITLVCPTCGGKLKVSPNATTLVCQFCGNEHMVKHDADGAIQLEAHGRCPICRRNDKVEKVSAVLATQTHQVTGIGTDGANRQQVSTLGQRLQPPPQPDPNLKLPDPPPPLTRANKKLYSQYQRGYYRKNPMVKWVMIGIVACYVIGIIAITLLLKFAGPAITGALGVEDYMMGPVFLIVFYGVSFGIAIPCGIFLSLQVKKYYREVTQPQYEQQVRVVKETHEREQDAWRVSLTRWNELYYCYRDDCVFLPGEGTSAPSTAMNEYLYGSTKGSN